jgi:hypothetical protein
MRKTCLFSPRLTLFLFPKTALALNYEFCALYKKCVVFSIETGYISQRYILSWFLSEVLSKLSPASYLVRFVTHFIF